MGGRRGAAVTADDAFAALDRLAAAGVPFGLAGRWAADALAGRSPSGPAEVVVPIERVADAVSAAGGALVVDARPMGGGGEARTLADGDVVDGRLAGRRLPCLRPEVALLLLLDRRPAPSSDDLAAARDLASAAGLSLPPLAGSPAGAPPAEERGDAVAGLSTAFPVPVGGGGGPEPAVVVRDVVPADAPAVASVHVASWRFAYADHMPGAFLAALDPVARWRQWARRLSSEEPSLPEATVVVAGPPGTVEGFAMYGPEAGGGADGEVHALYCHPAAIGAGRGRALLAAVTDRLRAAGFAEAVLWVLAGNERACRFYEAAGWAPDGATRHEEVGPPGDRITVPEVRYRARLA